MDEVDVANERAEHLTSMAIKVALSRQSQVPSSGICRVCGERIENARLRANPSAPTCCDCAAEEDAERQRRRKLGGRG
jgi:phage/conjugal plasmid C-4 type zinc finger TraR family protein